MPQGSPQLKARAVRRAGSRCRPDGAPTGPVRRGVGACPLNGAPSLAGLIAASIADLAAP
eukprot:1190238-Alexandrium_andersonii.AAC.1